MSGESSIGSPEGSMWYRAQYLRALLAFTGFYLGASTGEQKSMMAKMARRFAKPPKRTKDPGKLRAAAGEIVNGSLLSRRSPWITAFWTRIQQSYRAQLGPLVRSARLGWSIQPGTKYSLSKIRERLAGVAASAPKPAPKGVFPVKSPMALHPTVRAIKLDVEHLYPMDVKRMIRKALKQSNRNRGIKGPAMQALEKEFNDRSVEQGKMLRTYLPRFAKSRRFRKASAAAQGQLLKMLLENLRSAAGIYQHKAGVIRALEYKEQVAELKPKSFQLMLPILRKMVRDALSRQPKLADLVQALLKEYPTAMYGGKPGPNRTVLKALAILILDQKPERHFTALRGGSFRLFGLDADLGRIAIGQEYTRLLKRYLQLTGQLKMAQRLGVVR
jgi:hypothetical protein